MSAQSQNDIGLTVGVDPDSVAKLGTDVNKAAEAAAKKANLTLVQGLNKDLNENGEQMAKDLFGGFGNVAKAAISTIGTETLISLGAIASVAAVTFAGVGFAINEAFKFEGIRQVETEFDTLTQRAGVAGDALKNALSDAAKGTVSTNELLAGSNRALIELGTSAQKLPAIMEVARQASAIFGGTTIDNFTRINQAIEGGQTRQLRSLGIFVNSEQAVKDYAKSLNVSVDSLTQAGKQQAILNAVLEKGQTAFKGVAVVAPLTVQMQQWKASIEDVSNSLTKLVGGPIDKFLAFEVESDNKFFSFIKQTFGGFDKATDAASRLDVLNGRLTQLQSLLAKPNISEGAFTSLSFEMSLVQKQIANAQAAIAQTKQQAALLSKPGPTATSGTVADGTAIVDPLKAQATQLAFQTELAQTKSQAAQLEQARLQEQQAFLPNSTALEQTRFQNIAAVSQEYYLQEATARNKNAQDNVLSADQLNQKISALEQVKFQKIEQIDAQFRQKQVAADEQRISGLQEGAVRDAAIIQYRNDRKIEIEKEYQDQLKQLRKKYADDEDGEDADRAKAEVALANNAHQSELEAQRKFTTQSEQLSKQLGSAFNSGVTNIIVSGTQAAVKAMLKGQNGFKAFAAAAIGAFGDMATNVGEILIMTGLGIQSVEGLAGGAAVAAGIALVALGAIASEFSGSIGGTDTSGASSVASATDTSTATASPTSTAAAKTPMAPTIIIQGDVNDADKFGYVLQQTLQNHYNATGWSASDVAA